MLLAIDIGNSCIKFGVFNRGKLLTKVSVPTARDITSDVLALLVKDKLAHATTASIICSVVPDVDDAVLRFAKERSGVEPIVVTNDLDFGLTLFHHPLQDAGADRLVNAFSAAEKYGAPCIVCSLGTATTIDVVNERREMTGGLIAPGLSTLASALKASTSRLPEVELIKPEKVIQNTTVGAIQSGVVHGYIAMVDGLLSAVAQERGDAKVIATGGSAAMIAENTDKIGVVDGDLTLSGLKLLYERLQH